jgi:hypothetical protein
MFYFFLICLIKRKNHIKINHHTLLNNMDMWIENKDTYNFNCMCGCVLIVKKDDMMKRTIEVKQKLTLYWHYTTLKHQEYVDKMYKLVIKNEQIENEQNDEYDKWDYDTYFCSCGSVLQINDTVYATDKIFNGKYISLDFDDRKNNALKNHEKTKKHNKYISEFFDNIFK